MSRSLARELVLQLLYQLETNPEASEVQIEDFAIERLGQPATDAYIARKRDAQAEIKLPIKKEATASKQVFRRKKRDLDAPTQELKPEMTKLHTPEPYDPYLPISEDKDQQQKLDEKQQAYVTGVASEVMRMRPELDLLYAPYLKNWTLSRLPQVDRCILRLATYEIYHMDDVPVPVAVNEAVELARRFAAEDAYKYIHGVLGAMTLAHPELPKMHETGLDTE